MKTFFCHGLESGIRLRSPAKGYDKRKDVISFTVHLSKDLSTWLQGGAYTRLRMRLACRLHRQTLDFVQQGVLFKHGNPLTPVDIRQHGEACTALLSRKR
jgi:hypothetical protein